jgi:co-chaperonin GroES (HSP10)
MRMLNNNLLCKDLTQDKETISGFSLGNEERFKRLEVVESSEEDIPKGSLVKVPKNSGEETEEEDGVYIVIKRGEIINIL